MTDTNARKLADGSSRIMRRNTVYHLLLMMFVEATYVSEKCMFCNALLNYQEPHKPDCLRELTRRALTADHDDLAALLAELTERET